MTYEQGRKQKKGSKFRVIYDDVFELGEIVTLTYQDDTNCPGFSSLRYEEDVFYYETWSMMEQIEVELRND